MFLRDPSEQHAVTRATLSPLLRELSQCFGRVGAATDGEFYELRDIQPPAARLGTCDPPLILPDPIRQLPLREPGLFTHGSEKRRDSAVDQGVIALRGH